MQPMRRPVLLALAVIVCAALGSLAWWLLRDRPASLPSGPGLAAASPDTPQQPVPPVPRGPWAAGADVLLITIDTLRADAVGFAPPPADPGSGGSGGSGGSAGAVDRRAETPALDRLAAAGRVFTDAHAHNVVTLPSHANLLTGLYPFQHGVRDNAGFRLPETVPTLATLLAGAGYATAAFVGAYPLDSRFGLARGFEVYDDRYPRGSNPADPRIAERRGDEVVAAARQWWDERRGRRRFLWVHLYDPHAPYDPPEPFASRFRDRPYLGEVAAADSFLAPLLTPLLAGGEPPALVVVTSDHGEALGEHGELTHGLFAYEPTLKVPLVVWGAGIAPGRDGRPARHVDVLPTLLDALGVAAPAGLPGRSLLRPLAADGGEAGADSYFEALTANLDRGWAPLRGVVRGRQKLIELPVPELYDLARDPAEQANLFGEERRAARQLAAALPAASQWPPARGAVSAEEEARLRSLGYTVGSAGRKAAYGPDDDPKNLVQVDTALQQAVLAYTAGRYEEAAAQAREVIALRPAMADGPEQLALALRQLERHDEAIAALQEALARGVGDESLRRALGLALAEVGRAGEAVAVLSPAVPPDVGTAGAGRPEPEPATLIALGVALSDAGRPGEAVAVLERAGRLDPDDPKVHENLGIAELRRGGAAGANKARGHLERALALNQALPISWNTLGVARYQLGDRAGALTAWERAAALDPRQFDALFNLGLVAAEGGRPDLARQALARFVATAPPGRFGADLAKARQLLARLGG